MADEPQAVCPDLAAELLNIFSPDSRKSASLRMLFDAKREPLLRLRARMRPEPPKYARDPALADLYRRSEELAFGAMLRLEPESRPPVPAELDAMPWGVVWEEASNHGSYMGDLSRNSILEEIYQELASGQLRI